MNFDTLQPTSNPHSLLGNVIICICIMIVLLLCSEIASYIVLIEIQKLGVVLVLLSL